MEMKPVYYTLQEHKTVRQKGRPHWDLRFQKPGTKQFYSFALPKNLPRNKKKDYKLAIKTPMHDWKWFGEYDNVEIKEGLYGAGEIKTISKGIMLYIKFSAKSFLLIVLYDKKHHFKKYDMFFFNRRYYQNWVVFSPIKKYTIEKYMKLADKFLEENKKDFDKMKKDVIINNEKKVLSDIPEKYDKIYKEK